MQNSLYDYMKHILFYIQDAVVTLKGVVESLKRSVHELKSSELYLMQDLIGIKEHFEQRVRSVMTL